MLSVAFIVCIATMVCAKQGGVLDKKQQQQQQKNY